VPAVRSSTVLAQLALGRAAVGAVLLVRPRTLPDLLADDPAEGRQQSWVVQMLGAREVALGLGGAAALLAPWRSGARSSDARSWLAAGLLCDAVDALAVAAAVGSGRVRAGTGGAVVAVAAAAVAVQAGALARR
jgi:hypothetical protein